MVTSDITALEKKLFDKIKTSMSPKSDTSDTIWLTKEAGLTFPNPSFQAKIDAADTRFLQITS